MPELSVIMSVYNEPLEYVRESIDSVLHQTFADFEFLIVLDNPKSAQHRDLLERYSQDDRRVRLILHERNQGLAQSLNDALAESTGQYIARMDADDIALPERFKKEINYLDENKLDVVASLANIINDAGQVVDATKPVSGGNEEVNELLPLQNIFIHPTIIMRRRALINLDGYRLFSSSQDYDLWLRLLTAGARMEILNETLLNYRRHSLSVSSSKHFDQVINEDYIRRLYHERLRNNGHDSFSGESYQDFKLESRGAGQARWRLENEILGEFSSSLSRLKNGDMFALIGIVRACRSKWVRNELLMKLRVAIVRRKFSKLRS